MSLLSQIESTTFLGPEFLTWLWYKAETDHGRIDLTASLFDAGQIPIGDLADAHRVVTVAMADQILLSTDGPGMSTTDAFRGDAPDLSPEAAAALANGKLLHRAKITLNGDDTAQWPLTLHAQTLDLAGIKIPTPPLPDFEDNATTRLRALDDLETLLHTAFTAFIALRLTPEAWQAEAQAMRNWIAAKANPDPAP
jgi:hypothetical protein